MSDKDVRYTITAEDRFARTFSNLRRDLSGTREQFARVSAVAGTLVRLGTLGVVGGVAGLGLAVRRLANDLDALSDSADATGSTVEALSGLEDVARRNGKSLDIVTTSIVKMNEALAQAKPDSPASRLLKSIGLDAAELRRLDPAEALLRIAKAQTTYANDGDKARLMQQLFGKSLRDIVPYLNDLVEAGQINATVTSEQAEEAKKFNMQLAALQTNVGDIARDLTGALLPALNNFLDKLREARQTSGGLGELYKTGARQLLGGDFQLFTSGAQALDFYTGRVRELQAALAKLQANNPRSIYGDRAGVNDGPIKSLQAELERVQQLTDAYRRLYGAEGLPQATYSNEGRNRPKPSVGTIPEITKARVSEAERYLETLVKQREQLELQVSLGQGITQITASQQLQLELQGKRLDGITPKLQAQLTAEARRLDVARELDRLKEREAAFQKLIADAEQRGINDALTLLEQTPTGRTQKLELQVDQVLRVSRANPDDPIIQRQASEALEQLRKNLDEVRTGTVEAATEWDRLADTIDKGMDRATGAVLDFVIDGKGSMVDVGKAFARDIMRGLLEDPIRKQAKQLGQEIANALKSGFSETQGGKNLGGILSFAASLLGGGGGNALGGGFTGGWGIDWSWFTTRSNGGSVRAGQKVRWQENGREWFVPDVDGTVVTERQVRQRAGSDAPSFVTNLVVNGDVSAQTVALIEAAIARNNARMVRNMRTGGAMAG